MGHPRLEKLSSSETLRSLSVAELGEVAHEIRDVLCNLLATRTAHFASNLGVVELCLALHSVFDFRTDRLIWDTGHQVYPHKLVTGRYQSFSTIRTRGGLMGYPNPAESPYDLFMTGHAGCSVSTALGLRSGDRLLGQEKRKSIAVIGDGALPSGIVFEALNNAGELEEDLVVILNDNKMSICPRVGSLASYLDRVRNSPYYTGLKNEVTRILSKVPVFGDPTERMLAQIKEAVKAGVLQGILFEELGLRYFGPIDGHDLGLLRKYLTMIRDQKGPVLLHVVTEKGHGYRPAAEDPVYFHTPPSFRDDNGSVIVPKKSEPPAYTNFARDAIQQRMRTDSKVTVITAAMCQGNKLEPVREEFPQRFFDVGICESHAVAFAAGQCKVGLRPIVDIYSTFLQRSFDQIFQEVALQDLPVVFMMDRAGLTGPDGPTHHGTYDIGYMRMFPNLIVMAPGYAAEMERMLEFALKQFHPVSIRYPKANALERTGSIEEIQLGRSETLVTGGDGTLLAFGAILEQTLQAAELLQQEGICLEVINARFAKPLDTEMLLRVWGKGKFIMTIEEGALMTGFGSAVLEAANQSGLDTRRLRCLGIPDRFVEHGERHELLELLGLSAEGIARACRREIDRQAGERFGPIVTPTSHQEHHHFVETVPVHE